MSEQAILKAIDKAYPANNSEIEEEEEEEKSTRKKQKPTKTKTREPEPEEDEEEDWDDEEENENDYEEMTARELYKLCKERDIDCKPKRSKEYYIDLLEEYDESLDEDDWGDED